MPETIGKELTWVDFSDFTPGIISQSNYAYTFNDSPVPAKQTGAAQVAGTFGCIALPNGGLGPLPGIAKTVPTGRSLPAGTATAYINGAFVYGPIGTSDEIVYGLEYADTSNNRYFHLVSYMNESSTTTDISAIGPSASSQNLGIFPITGGLTRVNPTTPTDPGQPCLALAYTFFDNAGPTNFNWLYPSPASAGAVSLYTFSPSYAGNCLTHQNRVVILTLTQYPWIGTIGGQNTFIESNESFNYTDPPNSQDMGAQGAVFVQEHPFGAGAWGSISAGELFLVKNSGGAYVISGDLNFPTVTYLGGVTPTYNLLQYAAQTTVGFVYASQGNGVWLWNGSSQSTKLSENLNDDFFDVNSAANPIQFTAAEWGSWICMTNGWLMDTNTGGWWRLTNPGFPPMYYGIGCYGTAMWAVAAYVPNATAPALAQYSFATPETTYSWMSYPIPASRDQNIACERLAVRAQGLGTVTVTLTGINASTSVSSQTFTFDSNSQPQIINSSVGGGGGSFLAQDVTVTIVSTAASTGPAPIVYSVSVGYVPSSPASPG